MCGAPSLAWAAGTQVSLRRGRGGKSGLAKVKQTTRDNLIYVAVGLCVAALLAADAFYADSHGRRMWLPSKFAFRAVATTALVMYFVARETHRAKATAVQAFSAAMIAGLVQFVVVFVFRQIVEESSGISFSSLAVFEMFIVFSLAMWMARYLRIG